MFGLSRVCRNGLERSGAASDARSGVGCLERRRMPGAALETLGGVGCLKQRRTLEMASDAWSGVGHLACCRQSGRLRARQAAYKLRLRIFRAGAFVRRARSLSARAARDSARCSAGWAASDSGRVGPAPVFAFFEVAPRGFHYRPAAGTSTTLRRRTYHR